jgi:hypothetical protein
MIRDVLHTFAEMMFWVTDGQLLIDTPWTLVWFIVIPISLLGFPLWFAMHGPFRLFNGFSFMVGFFPVLLFTMGVPLIQVTMITQCENHSVTVVVNDTTQEMDMRRCRNRENYYNTQYGEWRIIPRR